MVKISCVSYLNSQPFIHGLRNNAISQEIELSLDIPTVCAEKLKTGVVDIGLVPVVLIPELKESHIVSDYCIGADGPVESVLLVSEAPLEEIETVMLDFQSRTSVILAKILAGKFWKIHPQWVEASQDFEKNIKGTTAAVVIGDKSFEMKKKYNFIFDLAAEWKSFTAGSGEKQGLPFVFACWVANKKLPSEFLEKLNLALADGLLRRQEIAKDLAQAYPDTDVSNYLMKNISYNLDEKKRAAMSLFLNYARELPGQAGR